MSSKARDSRGASVKWITGDAAGQSATTVLMKQRYVAVTSRLAS